MQANRAAASSPGPWSSTSAKGRIASEEKAKSANAIPRTAKIRVTIVRCRNAQRQARKTNTPAERLPATKSTFGTPTKELAARAKIKTSRVLAAERSQAA